MNDRYLIINEEIWQPYVTFMIFCSLAMIISTPSPYSIESGASTDLFINNPLFFFIYLASSAVFGLNMGAISKKRQEEGSLLLLNNLGRLILINTICIPLFIFQRALYPGRIGFFPLIALYGIVTGLLFCGISIILEDDRVLGVSQGFILKYFLLAAFFFSPKGMLSAMTSIRGLLLGGSAHGFYLDILVAMGLTVTIWYILLRNVRRAEDD